SREGGRERGELRRPLRPAARRGVAMAAADVVAVRVPRRDGDGTAASFAARWLPPHTAKEGRPADEGPSRGVDATPPRRRWPSHLLRDRDRRFDGARTDGSSVRAA